MYRCIYNIRLVTFHITKGLILCANLHLQWKWLCLRRFESGLEQNTKCPSSTCKGVVNVSLKIIFEHLTSSECPKEIAILAFIGAENLPVRGYDFEFQLKSLCQNTTEKRPRMHSLLGLHPIRKYC